jgi:hypothetical protein
MLQPMLMVMRMLMLDDVMLDDPDAKVMMRADA